MNRKMAQVHEIALEVRSWCEKEADKAGRTDTLVGYCAIASAELFRRLEKAGIFSEIHMHNSFRVSHVYLLIDDHVVDVTATQFSEFRYQPVVIIHYKEAEQHSFYHSDEIFGTAKDLRKFQTDAGWPNNQIAKA